MDETSIGVSPLGHIAAAILVVHGERVMMDADLANLYGVDTRILVRAVTRNPERFPPDFMFQLTGDEFKLLKARHSALAQWGGRRYPPYAFTEQGVAMLSSVLRSERAVTSRSCARS